MSSPTVTPAVVTSSRGSRPSDTPPTTSRRTAAVVAGAGYAAMFALAIIANFVVLEGLVVADDPAATLDAIAAAPGLFRLGTVAFVAIAVLDVIVAWGLHVLVRDEGADRSLLAAWLRVVYAALLGVAIASLVRVSALVETAGSGAADTLVAEVTTALATFEGMWQAGLLVFGLHLVVVATLLVGGVRAPRLLRGVLVLAGGAYVVDALLHLALVDHDAVATLLLPLVAVASVVSEGWLTGWLLLRAGRER